MEDYKETKALDIDDVVAPFTPTFLKWYNKNYKTDIKVNQVTEYSFKKVLKLEKEEITKRVNKFYESLDFLNLTPYTEAKKGVKQLAEKYKLIFITGRPKFLEEQTNIWLRIHFNNLYDNVFLTSQFSNLNDRIDKYEVCWNQEADTIVEDCLENAEECAKRGIDAVLINKPWNKSKKDHRGITRVDSWYGKNGILSKLI